MLSYLYFVYIKLDIQPTKSQFAETVWIDHNEAQPSERVAERAVPSAAVPREPSGGVSHRRRQLGALGAGTTFRRDAPSWRQATYISLSVTPPQRRQTDRQTDSRVHTHRAASSLPTNSETWAINKPTINAYRHRNANGCSWTKQRILLYIAYLSLFTKMAEKKYNTKTIKSERKIEANNFTKQIKIANIYQYNLWESLCILVVAWLTYILHRSSHCLEPFLIFAIRLFHLYFVFRPDNSWSKQFDFPQLALCQVNERKSKSIWYSIFIKTSLSMETATRIKF